MATTDTGRTNGIEKGPREDAGSTDPAQGEVSLAIAHPTTVPRNFDPDSPTGRSD